MSQAIPVSLESLGDFSQVPLPAGIGACDARELASRLALMTKKVFGCDVQVADGFDPESPEDRHVVFIVQPRASRQQLVEMEAEWVKQLRALAPDWEAVRLSIRLPE